MKLYVICESLNFTNVILITILSEHCQLSNWSLFEEWSNSNERCGERSRSREIIKPNINGGNSCEARYNCTNCLNEKETEICPGIYTTVYCRAYNILKSNKIYIITFSAIF